MQTLHPKTMVQPEEPTAAVDRISSLPNEILLHILSFLPTKEAFTTTTLLSKRWTPLPYSLTNLNFIDKTENDLEACKRFNSFINTIMLSHRSTNHRSTNHSIKSFRLKCYGFGITTSERYPCLDAWVEAAKQRCVEEFDLFLNHDKLNSAIFTSKTLVVLKLMWVKIDHDDLCFDLPLLKTLRLSSVCFENYMKRLLNSCPNLEDLYISQPTYVNKKKNDEEIELLFLTKLVRADVGLFVDVPFNAIYNIEFFSMSSLTTNVNEIFKDIPVFHNLIHVQLRFVGLFHDGWDWDCIVEFLQHCPKLQILYVQKRDAISSKDWDCPILDIECVSSHLRSCIIYNFDGSENDIRFTTYILQNAKLLQDMTIVHTSNSSNGGEKQKIVEELSSCPKMSKRCKLSLKLFSN